MLTKFILYTCPTGELATQIESYFALANARVGHNPAHDYMPHITLTGFFPDEPTTAATYVAVLDQLVSEFAPIKPTPVLTVTAVRFDEHFHGLEIESAWLQGLTVAFAERAESPTRPEAIRCKDWLHLSFAYGFSPEDQEPLRQLAVNLIDITASVQWELRFYEQPTKAHWICHQAWSLTGS